MIRNLIDLLSSLIQFRYPLVLFALVVPAAILVWIWVRHERRVVLPFDHGRPGTGAGWRFLINVAESVPALLLALVIILLAGPLRYSQPQTKRALTNIQLCVDISGSMTAQFGEGTRYDASMKAIDDFLNYRKGDAVGLTFFGNNFLHWAPLTSDISAIRCAPGLIRPETAPPGFGGTEIGKALRACKAVLTSREEGDRMIVLVSDGWSADLYNGNEIELAKELKQHNIVVYAIHIGGDHIPGEIANLTGLTGGEVFNPDDPETVKTVFRRIDQMQQVKLEKTLPETLDHFFPYCVAGLSLLGLSTLALFGLRYTPW